MPSFDADALTRERLATLNLDPIQFTAGGETFTCLPVLPLGTGIQIAHLPEDADDAMTLAATTNLMWQMVKVCIVPEQREAFDKALANPEHPVDPQTLIEIVQYLTECYTARPTEPPTASSSGRRTTSRKSSTGASKGASKTSKRSASGKAAR